MGSEILGRFVGLPQLTECDFIVDVTCFYRKICIEWLTKNVKRNHLNCTSQYFCVTFLVTHFWVTKHVPFQLRAAFDSYSVNV